MPVFIVIFLFSSESFAFLDFIGQEAKKATEAAAYADAVVDLASELSPDDELKSGASDIKKRTSAVRAESSQLRYVSNTTRSVVNGPDWSSKRLDSNIRSTTEYVRRVKRLVGRIAILGTDGAIALNTTETNVALNEVQKNQQAIILQNEDEKLREVEREQEEAHSWAQFSDRQRKLRNNEAVNGKL